MKTMPEIRIDRRLTLAEEPGTGHNRWHRDIPPVTRCDPEEEVILETRDAFDGQFGPETLLDVVGAPDLGLLHPLTGPVYVDGAEPGDLLDIEILDLEVDRYGYTVQGPGFGFLREVFPDPFKVNWDIADRWTTSTDRPGIRIRAHRSRARLDSLPVTSCSPPSRPANRVCPTMAGSCSRRRPRRPCLAHALRTLPPREQAGNIDIKQLQGRSPTPPGRRPRRAVLRRRRPLRPRGL
jgi:formamidase